MPAAAVLRDQVRRARYYPKPDITQTGLGENKQKSGEAYRQKISLSSKARKDGVGVLNTPRSV
jgi:hypothetical protein